jgi:hypothetical protein
MRSELSDGAVTLLWLFVGFVVLTFVAVYVGNRSDTLLYDGVENEVIMTVASELPE